MELIVIWQEEKKRKANVNMYTCKQKSCSFYYFIN